MVAVWGLCWVCPTFAAGDDSPRTGLETEKRFPPLKVSEGFKATLFACDPLIEYPSAIALGPRADSVFVAADYMTGLGTEIVRRDEIRLVEDTDGDGYADKAQVFADQFNSIMGLTYHRGTVFVMHSPFLTALRDTDGDGKADKRRDLLSGLGLTPEDNPVRLHCANGLVMGHDGWLYLALGDHGCKVKRPEGDELVLNGGGILRCRPDGRDLHVFATGLRNIYDVALDAELNVFVRDNENDGGDYKIRVCHSFFGADHGYPYLYYERPNEALPPIADLGLGSSAGGVCYLERQFPAEYHGNLIFCEWGRSVVRYRPQRTGTGFDPVQEIEFAAGAENDPYGFKPTDVIVERDGSLMVADWADGQRPKRGRARIYRIRYVGEANTPASQPPGSKPNGVHPPDDADRSLDSWIMQLNSPSYYERVHAQDAITSLGAAGLEAVRVALTNSGRLTPRGRWHGVWILASDGSQSAREKLFDLARTDAESSVRAQAIRALADLMDPVLVRHRLDSGPGDAEAAARLASLADGKDRRVLLEVGVAVGRLQWANAPYWLRELLASLDVAPLGGPRLSLDPTLAHALTQTLRRSGDWPAVLKWLYDWNNPQIRSLAVRAVADQAVPNVADGLMARLDDPDMEHRIEFGDALTRVARKPGPWVYWGYRPPPRPANTVEWERTAAIEDALDRLLADRATAVRLAVLRRMQREKIPARLATLDRWLEHERDADSVATILDSVREHPADRTCDLLGQVVASGAYAPANRLTALALMAGGLDETNAGRLLELAREVDDGPVLAELFGQLSRLPKLDAASLFIGKLNSPSAEVRTAAVASLAELRVVSAGEFIRNLLKDNEVPVRAASAAAMGRLEVKSSVEALLRLAANDDASVRGAALGSLRMLGERRAVPLAVAALYDRTIQSAALECLADLGGPDQVPAVIDVAHRDPSPTVLTLAVRALTAWSCRDGLPVSRRRELDAAMADLHGRGGLLVRWEVHGPLPEIAAQASLEEFSRMSPTADGTNSSPMEGSVVLADGIEGRVSLKDDRKSPATGAAVTEASGPRDATWLASVDISVEESTSVQFLASSGGKLSVWMNGRRIHQRERARAFQADSDRFDGTLSKGMNRIVVQVAAAANGAAEFHVRFRRKSSTAELEALVQAALTRAGNAERGKTVFFDTAKAQCSKCHRIGDQGERIGPELTGVGSRFSRIHIVESILEPSRTVTPGYQTFAVALRDGRVLAGIKVSETEATLVLADNQGQKHILAKADIEEQRAQTQSTMPDGLTKQLTVDQFVDLLAFLVSQKKE
jgi:putative membrane-bound dehydrogenase-like protein